MGRAAGLLPHGRRPQTPQEQGFIGVNLGYFCPTTRPNPKILAAKS